MFNPKIVSSLAKTAALDVYRFLVFTFLLSISSTLNADVLRDIERTVTRINSKTGAIDNKVNTLRNQTNAIEDNLLNLPGTVQNSLGINLDPETTDRLYRAIDDVKLFVQEQNIKLNEFGDGLPGDGCYTFRESMKTLFSNLVVVTTSLQSIGQPVADAQELADLSLLETVPCEIWFGASVAFEQTPLSDLADRLNEMSESLQDISVLFEVPSVTTFSLDAALVDEFRTSRSLDATQTVPEAQIEKAVASLK